MLRQVLTAEEERALISRLERKAGRPAVFDRHFFTPDWARLGQQSVNMMNMVREPVARIISGFYFARDARAGWGHKRKRPQHLQSWFNKDFESCVGGGDPECQVGLGGMTMQVTFFCGSHVQCANSTNPRVLQAAKYNLENR